MQGVRAPAAPRFPTLLHAMAHQLAPEDYGLLYLASCIEAHQGHARELHALAAGRLVPDRPCVGASCSPAEQRKAAAAGTHSLSCPAASQAGERMHPGSPLLLLCAWLQGNTAAQAPCRTMHAARTRMPRCSPVHKDLVLARHGSSRLHLKPAQQQQQPQQVPCQSRHDDVRPQRTQRAQHNCTSAAAPQALKTQTYTQLT